MVKSCPTIKLYDQDFGALYKKTVLTLEESTDDISASFFVPYTNRRALLFTFADHLYTDLKEFVNLAWIEFFIYHKTNNRKRVSKMIRIIDEYMDGMKEFQAESGLYILSIDITPQVAATALYMSALAEIINDRDMIMKYKKLYFSLKGKINRNFDSYTRISDQAQLLIAEIVNEDRASEIVSHIPEELTASETFLLCKGLEKYQRWDIAKEIALRCVYDVIDSKTPTMQDKCIASTLMIENIIGLSISFARKTVDWIIPNIDTMGVENLVISNNEISIVMERRGFEWVVQIRNDKLFYFCINILGQKKKTLPIPAGQCSIMLNKI